MSPFFQIGFFAPFIQKLLKHVFYLGAEVQEIIISRKNRLLLVVQEYFHCAADARTTKLPTKLARLFFPDAFGAFTCEKALNSIHEIAQSVAEVRSGDGDFGVLVTDYSYSPTMAL